MYLHELADFADLIAVVADREGIDPVLVEKDYWIMHALYGLQQQDYTFILKGGTSLSKGYGIINRFSEDIDIFIEPAASDGIGENKESTKPNAVNARRQFYETLANTIQINGIVSVTRDHEFDDPRYYRSGGIRLNYNKHTGNLGGVKDGILLEVGFAKVTPNTPVTITSWIYEHASQIPDLEFNDNRAVDVSCYLPGYSLVEKLQTIIRLHRQEAESGKIKPNRMRQYYDVCCLLDNDQVQAFIGTEEYKTHKQNWITGKDAETPIPEHQAFLIPNEEIMEELELRYIATKALYYRGQPDFKEVIEKIQEHLHRF